MTAITKKIWTLNKYPLYQNDCIWITSLGCNLRFQPDDPEEILVNGRVYHYAGGPSRAIIETTCEKQESMLKLKYGDQLILNHVFHEMFNSSTVFPG